MAPKRTLDTGRAVSNEQAISVDGLIGMSRVDLGHETVLDGVH
jgi:hypothetical protein